MTTTPGWSRITTVLVQHELRRQEGVPTVSVLLGPVGISGNLARQWGEQQGFEVIPVSTPSPRALAQSLLERLAGTRDLASDAYRWLQQFETESRGGGPGADPRPLATSYDLSRWLAKLKTPTEAPASYTNQLARWLLERVVAEGRLSAQTLVERLAEGLPLRDRERERQRARSGAGGGAGTSGGGANDALEVVLGLVQLIPGTHKLMILLAPANERDVPPAWIDEAARTCAALAGQAAETGLILALDPESWDAYAQTAPESRARTLLREGLITFPIVDAYTINRWTATTPEIPPANLIAGLTRLITDGSTEELMREYMRAAKIIWQSPAGDLARNAAQRFLHLRLESLGPTCHLFQLNQRLDIPMGSVRTMELDLVSQKLKIAVEIDSYHHFQNIDAYRRDRRKDVALQTNGYIIMRFLAEDVIRRLDDILDAVLATVNWRRQKS